MFNINIFNKKNIKKEIDYLLESLYRLNYSLVNLQNIYEKKKYEKTLNEKEELLLSKTLNEKIIREFQFIVSQLNSINNEIKKYNINLEINNFLNFLNDKLKKIENISLDLKEYEYLRVEIIKLIKSFIQIKTKIKKEKNRKIVASIISGILISTMPYFFQKNENSIKSEPIKREFKEKIIHEEYFKNINKELLKPNKFEKEDENKTKKKEYLDENNEDKNKNINLKYEIFNIIYKYIPTEKELKTLIKNNDFIKKHNEIFEKFQEFKKGNFNFTLEEFKELKILAKYSNLLLEKGFINSRISKDFDYIYELISNKFKIKYVKIRVNEYINKNKSKFQKINIEKYLYVRGKYGPELTGNLINLSNINKNLSYNIYVQSKKFNLNLKLILSIFLLENNFGNIKTSSAGAKGLSQIKDEVRKKYFPNDDSLWAYFMSTFYFLEEEPKKLDINIKNFIYNVEPIDFALGGLFYHEGMTRFLNNIDDILAGNGEYLEGRDYIDKLMSIYYFYKFRINIDQEGKKEIII
jgi:hypothetical protein